MTGVASGIEWSQILFEVLVPVGVLIMAGLLHVVYRLGLVSQEVKQIRNDLNRMWQTQSGTITYRRDEHDTEH